MTMNFLLLIGIGALAGFVATRLLRFDADVPTTMAIGAGGAVVGWLALRFLATAGHWLALAVAAVAGAMLIVVIWRHLRR
jgi:uncharacterized membrane protein YeaQ/YmgE (transglycosylase-associated protein family)